MVVVHGSVGGVAVMAMAMAMARGVVKNIRIHSGVLWTHTRTHANPRKGKRKEGRGQKRASLGSRCS